MTLADIGAPRADRAYGIAKRSGRLPRAAAIVVCKSAAELRDEYLDAVVATQCSIQYAENETPYAKRKPIVAWLNANYCGRGVVPIECERCRNHSQLRYSLQRAGEFVSSNPAAKTREEIDCVTWLCRTCAQLRQLPLRHLLRPCATRSVVATVTRWKKRPRRYLRHCRVVPLRLLHLNSNQSNASQ